MQSDRYQDASLETSVEFRKTYGSVVNAIERALQVNQAARQAYVRLLLTLSSGAVVLSMSLLRYWITQDTEWLFLLPVSWACFGVSVLTCLAQLAMFGGYDWIVPILRFLDSDAESLTDGLDAPIHRRVSHALGLLEEPLRSVLEPPKVRLTALAANVGFIAGLLTLAAFATKNLPWSQS